MVVFNPSYSRLVGVNGWFTTWSQKGTLSAIELISPCVNKRVIFHFLRNEQKVNGKLA